ncbi:PAPA-1-like conserved region-domain-containing protein [Rhexocercosporidium sp. MPI-PUGE-AT-0058]|nr:PAPA-1-like conserved region-domain-containing protein [Rhexocercosporidium sp. MPI-PUGE-AT-0058]
MSGRPERPSKKPRKLSTDSEGSEEPIDWAATGTGTGTKGSSATSRGGRAEKATAGGKNESSRARRTTSENVASMATVSRGPPSATSQSPASMRLTVKTSSSKLREATRSSSSGNSAATNARDPFIGGQIIEGKRARNVRKSYVLESDSDEEEDDEDEEMEEVGDEDAELEEDEDEDMDAEDDGMGEEDAEGDIDMEVDVPPPPPVIKVSRATGKATRDVITVKPPVAKGKVLPVEQKEMEDASDDEELSELDSDLGEEVEEEEGMQTGNEEDAEGEEEEIEVEDEGEEEDDDSLDSDDETPAGGSRASTPDLNKLTKRQRARFEESDGGHLLALPDEVQVKKHLTAEEHAMRRAEMARRRKNLSEKRNEEEKLETINKLLKKQAPKTNARRAGMNAADNPNNGSGADGEPFKPHAMYVRWVSNKDGNRIGVPEEWLDAPVGKVFAGSVKAAGGTSGSGIGGGKLVEEVA